MKRYLIDTESKPREPLATLGRFALELFVFAAVVGTFLFVLAGLS